MDVQHQNTGTASRDEHSAGSTRTFARRIDCAPAPRRPAVAGQTAHGYGRAPGEMT